MSHHPQTSTYKYKAFISYSHLENHALSRTIQQALHNFARPYFARRALHVFRDQTDLSASHSLPDLIKKSLNDSEYFILLASPRAAASEWVKREIDEWLRIHDDSPDKVLIVWTKGDLLWDSRAGDFDWNATNALPQVLDWDPKNATPTTLRGKFIEPFYQDFRAFGGKPAEELSLRNPEFLDGVATIAATLHGKTKSDMVSAEVEQHSRYKRVRARVLVALIALAMLASSAAVYANRQRGVAEERRAQAEESAEKERVAIQAERVAIAQRNEASIQRDEASKQRDVESQKRQEEARLKEQALNDKEQALIREKAALENAERERRQAEHRAMEVDHTKLLATLASDETSLPAPTNPSRMDLLNNALGLVNQLVQRAQKLYADTNDASFDKAAVAYQQTEEELSRRTSCLPSQAALSTLLPPDANRLWAGFSASGKKFSVVYADHIDVYDANNYSQPIQVLKMDQLPARTRAHILRARSDVERERLIFEVEYDHYARTKNAGDVKGSAGGFYKVEFENNRDPIEGREREILSWSLDQAPPTSAGFRIRLTETAKTDATGDADCGRVYLPVDGEMSIGRATSAPNKFGEFIRQTLKLTDSKKQPARVSPIVHTADGKQGLYMVEDVMNIDKDEDPIFHIYPVLSDGNSVLKLDEGVLWAKDGELLCDAETGDFPATSMKPNYLPAAVDFAHGIAVLRGKLIRIKDGKATSSAIGVDDFQTVREVGITNDGAAVILYFIDGGVAFYDVGSAKINHRFLPIAGASVTTVSPDGKQIILLREDGRLDSWEFSVFGDNGWAQAQCPFTTSDKALTVPTRTASYDDDKLTNTVGNEHWNATYEEALYECDVMLLRGLLDAGLNPNTKDGRGEPLLIKSLKCQDRSLSDVLISYGANINATNESGSTMLMQAIIEGADETVQMLLSKGADVNIVAKDGSTALSHAVSKRSAPAPESSCEPKIVAALLSKGASTNVKLRGGNTLLMAAAESTGECLSMLLNRGDMDVNARNEVGFTPLFTAIYGKHPESVRMLIDAGATLNAKTISGDTPLMTAVQVEDIASVRILLSKGASINETDNHNMTALMMAARAGNLEIVQVLIQKGARTDMKDREGKTAAKIAEEAGHAEIARLLSTRRSAGNR